MSIEVIIGNQQQAVEIPESWLTGLENACPWTVGQALQAATCPQSILHGLAEVEVTLVDDATSARVHQQFMNIGGATDVITFHHGEIVVGAEVARRQAEEYGEPLLREIYRYLVHGLLHLAGHDDADATQRAAMEAAQEAIVASGWKSLHHLQC